MFKSTELEVITKSKNRPDNIEKFKIQLQGIWQDAGVLEAFAHSLGN
jgi:hypothetical protein